MLRGKHHAGNVKDIHYKTMHCSTFMYITLSLYHIESTLFKNGCCDKSKSVALRGVLYKKGVAGKDYSLSRQQQLSRYLIDIPFAVSSSHLSESLRIFNPLSWKELVLGLLCDRLCFKRKKHNSCLNVLAAKLRIRNVLRK